MSRGNVIIMAGNILSMGEVVIAVGANIITADRNVITVGINVIALGRNVIASSQVITYFTCSHVKWAIITFRPNMKLTETLLIIKIDKCKTSWKQSRGWMRRSYRLEDLKNLNLSHTYRPSALDFARKISSLRSERSSHLAAR